jgi:hypothetical protein
MSDEITVAQIKQFGNTFRQKFQQRTSKWLSTSEVKHIKGKETTFESISPTDDVEDINTQFPDTPIGETKYGRRTVKTKGAHTARLVDPTDVVRIITDPTSAITSSLAAMMGRKVDKRAFAAAFGTAYEGEEGETPVAFPAANVIAAGGDGLTLTKLMDAKEIFDNRDIPDDNRYVGITGSQLRNLLNTTEIKNSDYNNIKALVNGQVNHFLGFTFMRFSQSVMPLDENNYRRIPVWYKGALGCAINEDIKIRIDMLPTKSYAKQIYIRMDNGWGRIDDDLILEMKCVEAA